MFKRIMYATLFVSDHKRALEFHATMFGFQKRADCADPERRFVTMALDGEFTEVLPRARYGRPAKRVGQSAADVEHETCVRTVAEWPV